MRADLKLLDIVVVAEKLENSGVEIGAVGTIVEQYEDGACLVEFSDRDGCPIDFVAFKPDQLILDTDPIAKWLALATDPQESAKQPEFAAAWRDMPRDEPSLLQCDKPWFGHDEKESRDSEDCQPAIAA